MAGRSCEDCRKWQYNDAAKVGGRRLLRGGLPVLRPDGQPTPCYRCPKIPVGAAPVPASAAEWGEKNWRAYQFHQRCKAVGRFPADAIVQRHAGLIESTLEAIRDSRQEAVNESLISLAQLAIVKR